MNSSSSLRRATHRLGLFSMASRAGSSDWRISQILKLIRKKTQSRCSEFNTGAPQGHDDAGFDVRQLTLVLLKDDQLWPRLSRLPQEDVLQARSQTDN
jgi:hypothetical protein